MPIIDKGGKQRVRAPRPDTLIWRYMDLPKFVAMLETRTLYLVRLGLLAALDPYEGQVPQWLAKQMAEPGRWTITESGDLSDAIKRKILAEFGPKFINSLESTARQRTYVNCWHINKHESDAMWRLYALRGQGIAIQTTYSGLYRALLDEPKELFAGEVTYGDYVNHFVDLDNDIGLPPEKWSSLK